MNNVRRTSGAYPKWAITDKARDLVREGRSKGIQVVEDDFTPKGNPKKSLLTKLAAAKELDPFGTNNTSGRSTTLVAPKAGKKSKTQATIKSTSVYNSTGATSNVGFFAK
jgi:hypothetical protein